jgi:hypothetical protein
MVLEQPVHRKAGTWFSNSQYTERLGHDPAVDVFVLWR